MYDFISLYVKCPMCTNSLMDKEKLIDNKPSIHLNIEMDGKKGSIALSSIYGSFNFNCNIDLPVGHLAKFTCRSCNKEITSKEECLSCGAPMVPFYLDMGGKVSICSRSSCKNHFVEFEDLTTAMQRLYEEYGYEDSQNSRDNRNQNVPEAVVPDPVDERKEIIESGAFLHSYCPHCHKSLIENDLLKLKIRKGDIGLLMLSPFLNVFSTKSTIFLPEEQPVEDIMCWHCDNSLIPTDKQCEKCGSKAARINVGARTKLIDFYICTKKGCRWHGVSEEDMQNIKLEDSMEW